MSNLKNAQNYFSLSSATQSGLKNSLRNLLLEFSANSDLITETLEFIASRYSEKHRAYHNLSHVNAVLDKAQNLRGKFADLVSVQLAIWFHDLIYDPKRFDNEIESAKLATEFLDKLEVPKEKIKKVEQLILATQKHDPADLDFDGQLFLDLDLSILGQKAEVYQNYSSAIRKEYSFVPWFLYKRARRKILENFLEREFIYFTDEIRQTYESNARLNIQREIKELS
jgi:predicted metal-dependent HD superfamily phosphohydrolase